MFRLKEMVTRGEEYIFNVMRCNDVKVHFFLPIILDRKLSIICKELFDLEREIEREGEGEGQRE